MNGLNEVAKSNKKNSVNKEKKTYPEIPRERLTSIVVSRGRKAAFRLSGVPRGTAEGSAKKIGSDRRH